jgi:hypothetical protein
MKQIRNQKKKDHVEINIIIIITEKNHKLDLKDKIKNYKNFNKRVKEKKSKVEGLNRKILYMQIRIEGSN